MRTLTPLRIAGLAFVLVVILAFFLFPTKPDLGELPGDEAGTSGEAPDGSFWEAGLHEAGHRMTLTGSPPCFYDAGIGEASIVDGGILCNGACKNSQTDNNNCGICGEVCPCTGSFNYCENCTNGACCISKGANCQYAPAGLCCDGSTCTATNTGTSTCQ
jgi:hypothetical protein